MQIKDIHLPSNIEKALKEQSIFALTDIQQKAIPLIQKGEDVVGISQTGTGKTLAFLIPIIQKLDVNNLSTQALIVVPTRELAVQIKKEGQKLCKYNKGIHFLAIYGGADINQQIFAFKKKPQVVIGTAGRLLDHIRRHTLKLNELKFLVLDEADEMFNMGFRKDIIKIIEKAPQTRQTLLFSATMNDEVLDLSKNYMLEPKNIEIGKKNESLKNITQTYFLVPKDKKKKALHSLFIELERAKTLIFCNTKKMVGGVQSYLEKMGYPVLVLHGDMPQSQRNQVMQTFRGTRSDILITTDVAARGIDVKNIKSVINFDLPPNKEQYLHRMGRTGRAGEDGNVFTILDSKEQETKLLEVVKSTNSKISLGFLQLKNLDEEKSKTSKSSQGFSKPVARHNTKRKRSPFLAKNKKLKH